MKKLVLLVAIVVTGLVSAKDAEKKEIVKEAQASETDDPEGRMQCYEYAMYIPCRDFYITDTQCCVQALALPHGMMLDLY
ncbi:hypothetical protein [Chryseobacterium wanjuense]